jgi:hypothetical protein
LDDALKKDIVEPSTSHHLLEAEGKGEHLRVGEEIKSTWSGFIYGRDPWKNAFTVEIPGKTPSKEWPLHLELMGSATGRSLMLGNGQQSDWQD